MLFSEPKIPQTPKAAKVLEALAGFSALQRAENSSNLAPAPAAPVPQRVSVLFSEPKIPQIGIPRPPVVPSVVSVLFSEPKIPQKSRENLENWVLTKFQCSSASRKFLKPISQKTRRCWRCCFSALQRAENSSKMSTGTASGNFGAFQCSSASRKFLKHPSNVRRFARRDVSVLFSEPKIPQTTASRKTTRSNTGFSALQRAENSSNGSRCG